jgi:hypothetical protein
VEKSDGDDATRRRGRRSRIPLSRILLLGFFLVFVLLPLY